MRLKLAARSNTQRTDYPSVWGMERCGILSSSDTSWKAVMHGPECHSDSDRIILQRIQITAKGSVYRTAIRQVSAQPRTNRTERYCWLLLACSYRQLCFCSQMELLTGSH